MSQLNAGIINIEHTYIKLIYLMQYEMTWKIWNYNKHAAPTISSKHINIKNVNQHKRNWFILYIWTINDCFFVCAKYASPFQPHIKVNTTSLTTLTDRTEKVHMHHKNINILKFIWINEGAFKSNKMIKPHRPSNPSVCIIKKGFPFSIFIAVFSYLD